MKNKMLTFQDLNYSNRELWDNVYQKDMLIKQGLCDIEELEKNGIPSIPLSLWCDFRYTGNRVRFEHNFFMRRKFLANLVIYEGIQQDKKALSLIADLIWAICEESSWCLPAHNSYKRDTPQLPLPDVSSPVIDLFAAETGALLSTVYAVCREELEYEYPGISERIKYEVTRRVLTPYQNMHFWWMGNGDEPMLNWTVWCTQNVLISAAVIKSNDIKYLDFALDKAKKSIGFFLKDYGQDGCCNEGSQYYRHAGLCMFGSFYIMELIKEGASSIYQNDEKIKNIAEYIAHMHVAGDYYINYADCSPLSGHRSVREYLFGQFVGSNLLSDFAASSFATDTDPYKFHVQDDSEGINLWYQLLTAFLGNSVYQKSLNVGLADINEYHYYPSVGLLKMCSDNGSYIGAIKAGNNDDNHNHNDVGSVTLYVDGKPLLIDIGVESYTRKTFSDKRYEIWTMQSSWHNLPEFDPDGNKYMQMPGKDYAANVLELYEDKSGMLVDIAGAYNGPDQTVLGLNSYTRSIKLNDNGVVIEDRTDYPGLVALTLMTRDKMSVDTINRSILRCAGSQFDIAGMSDVEITPVEVTDPRLLTAWPSTIYRTRLLFYKNITIKIKKTIL